MQVKTIVKAGRAVRAVWPLTAVFLLAALGTVSWVTTNCSAQIDPGMRPSEKTFALVVYEGDNEVGRVYRDVPGPEYNEHWVLFPNFSFDQGGSRSMRIVAVPGPGYTDVDDFLARVPFPAGSRYVCTVCQEFDRLPTND